MLTTHKKKKYKKTELYTEMQLRIINAVKKYPDLYTKNTVNRMTSWELVAEEVNEPVELCKRKWKSIRDQRRRAIKRQLQSGEQSKYLESDALCFLSDYREQYKSNNSSDTVIIEESEDSSNLQDTTILTQDMIESMLKKKENELSTGVNVKDINVKSIVNGIINNFESLLLLKQIDEMTKAPASATNVNNIAQVTAPSTEPVFVINDDDNIRSNSEIASSEDTNNLFFPISNDKAANKSDNSALQVELESTAVSLSHRSGNEIEVLQPQVTSFNNDSSLSTITQSLPTIQSYSNLQATNVTATSTSSVLDVALKTQSLSPLNVRFLNSSIEFIKDIDNVEPLNHIKHELKSRKRKYSDSSSSCSETSVSPDKEKNVSILDVDCNEKDMNFFFNNLAEYIPSRFSKDKQMEIRLRICSMLTHAEMEELKPNKDD